MEVRVLLPAPTKRDRLILSLVAGTITFPFGKVMRLFWERKFMITQNAQPRFRLETWIKPWGNALVPKIVQDSAKTVVGWNITLIVEAIRKYSL